MKAPLFLFLLVPQILLGALPFTTEEFNTALNTSRWFIYDYESRTFDTPDWNAVSGGGNPEASTTFTGASGKSILANEGSSLGVFTGDFLSTGITGIDCDIYVEDSANLFSVEFFFLHDGVFYFSDPFSVNRDGWSILQYSFTTDPWYTIVDGVFAETLITDEILSDVIQIGADFFPTSAAAIGSRVGLDNFTLMGHVPTTPIDIESGEEIELSFNREDGLIYTIQSNDSLESENWSNLSPETTDLTGTEPFQTTISHTLRQFLRLVTRPVYYSVPDIGA